MCSGLILCVADCAVYCHAGPAVQRSRVTQALSSDLASLPATAVRFNCRQPLQCCHPKAAAVVSQSEIAASDSDWDTSAAADDGSNATAVCRENPTAEAGPTATMHFRAEVATGQTMLQELPRPAANASQPAPHGETSASMAATGLPHAAAPFQGDSYSVICMLLSMSCLPAGP